jgi:hypothetical protein
MRSIVTDLAQTRRLDELPVLAVIERTIPHHLIQEVVAAHAPATRRCRRLPYELTLLLVIAMNLFAHDGLCLVLTKLLTFARLQWPVGRCLPASKGGISRARARLGIHPVADLFHRVCRPLATPATPGAFRWGWRLMALDSFTELVADTPANERGFGRHRGQHGQAAFPQVLVTTLVECGTHATIDACIGPCHSSAPAAARRLLRSVTAGMLLLADSGLGSTTLVHRAVAQGAQILGRVSSSLLLEPVAGLADGSYLARLYADAPSRRTAATPFVVVRVLVSTLTDPERAGAGEVHRLITSLCDPVRYPARDLICTYHERWEIELTIDEIDTHQRPAHRPLRSKTPQGVIQELYGLLLAHYVVRAFMHEAACRGGVDPDRLSFVSAVGLLVTVLPIVPVLGRTTRKRLHEHLLDDLLRVPLPPRELRSNPRTIKRKTSTFRHRAPGPRPSSLRLPFVHAVLVSALGAALQCHAPPIDQRAAA